jgi:Holliday junction resolvase
MRKDRQKPDAADFYDLTPSEFEKLVAAFFAQAGYSNVRLVGGPADQGVDILATKDNHPVAIQVKHKTRLTLEELQRFVDRYFANPTTPRNLVFVTSAEVPRGITRRIERIPKGASLDIVDRFDLQMMVAANSALSEEAMKSAAQRLRSQRRQLFFSALAGIVSLIVGVLSYVYPIVFPQKAPLDKRIETVEKALASMHNLETYLTVIKRDMEETQKATAAINQRYAEAKELEKLTAAQLAGLQATLQVTNWTTTILNYVLGFVLGIASSFVASILYVRWKQRKALE